MSELTDAEHEQLVKATPVYQGEVKAEPPFDEQISRQIRRDQKRLEQQQYSEELEARIRRQQEAEARLFEISTGGRHKLLDPRLQFQCLWKNVECPICEKSCKQILEGYNPNVEIANIPRDELFESGQVDDQLNFTKKHSCPENPVFLKKRIEYLENNLKLLDKSIDDRIRQALYINAAGR